MLGTLLLAPGDCGDRTLVETLRIGNNTISWSYYCRRIKHDDKSRVGYKHSWHFRGYSRERKFRNVLVDLAGVVVVVRDTAP